MHTLKPMFNWRYPALYKDLDLFGFWFALAIFSLLTTLWLPYQGEEAVYTITSMEMYDSQDWFVPTQYGLNYARPPLLNWLMIPLATLLGWQQVLVASRLLTVIITLCTSLLLIWFAEKCFKNRALAFFSALIYLSGDVLFRRGWLAYADPLFTLCVFAAMACLWVALQEKRYSLVVLAILGVIASFLAKAITGYVFYGITLLVLFYKKENREFLLTKQVIALHFLALLFPVLWNYFFSHGAHNGSMLKDVLVKLNVNDILGYGLKIVLDPINTLARWFPAIGILGYYWFKQRHKKAFFGFVKRDVIKNEILKNTTLNTMLWILFLNYLPYWLAPVSHLRYIMPLYPVFALVLAYLLWQLGQEKIKVVMLWLIAGILMRYVAGIIIFPYYEQHYRADYKAIAQDVLSVTANKPLYILDVTATGLSVTAHLDVIRMPQRPITLPPATWDQGYVLTNTPEYPDATVTKSYLLGRNPLYLLCRGKDCS